MNQPIPFWKWFTRGWTPVMVLALFLSAASTAFAFAGGIVDFENFSNSQISTNSVHNGPATGLISCGAGTYYFALFAACTSHTTVDATLDNGTNCGWGFEDVGTSTASPGLMNGNYTTDPGVDVGWPIGSEANFVVAGWSANIGTTWAQAKAWWNNGHPNAVPVGYFGISGIATNVLVGGSVYPVPAIFGPTPGFEIQGFTLNLYTDQVATLPATQVGATTATLNGSVNPGGLASMAWFEWGLDTTYGNSTPAVNIGSGSSPIPMSAALTGLRQDVFYHFRVVRNDGTATTFGWDSVFGTSPGTLTVTSLADSGSGTLRDLLTIAVPGDTITFAPGLTGSIMLGQSLPTVNKAVTIIGPGAASVALSGSGLNISNGVTASVSGLTITNVLVDERLQVLLVHIARGDHLAFWQGEE